MSKNRRRVPLHLAIGDVRIHLSELGFVLVMAVAILLLTTAPYIYAYATSPPDRQFMGIMLDVPDTAQYFSWMRGSAEGFLIPNRMTPEPNPARARRSDGHAKLDIHVAPSREGRTLSFRAQRGICLRMRPDASLRSA